MSRTTREVPGPPARSRLVAFVATLGIAVLAVAAWAWLQLDSGHRQEALTEFVKLTWQFLVIVLLGGLVAAAISLARERRERQEEVARATNASEERRRRLRESYVRRLIDCSHQVERAHWIVPANRSVKTWSEATIDELIPALLGLRNIQHDLDTRANAEGEPVFADAQGLTDNLKLMEQFLEQLVDEFSENKKELSKIQRLAEKETDDAEWSRRQDDVWTKLSALEHLSGLLARTDGTYGTFRDAYLRTLTEMRAQLAGRSESPARAASRRGRAARS